MLNCRGLESEQGLSPLAPLNLTTGGLGMELESTSVPVSAAIMQPVPEDMLDHTLQVQNNNQKPMQLTDLSML